MKVATYNTLHCSDYFRGCIIDFDAIADAILQTGADVVGLNEMRGAGVDPEYTAQTEALAERTGMPYFYFAKAIEMEGHGPYGNAILSRVPILAAEVIPVPDPPVKEGPCAETRCLLKVQLSGGVTVLVIHFGLYPEEQKNAVKTVLAHMPSEKCILMGDFNLRPESEILRPICACMKDTASLFDAPKGSFPSGEPRCKIDYIFVSPDLAVTEADIPPIAVSDHRPHTANILL